MFASLLLLLSACGSSSDDDATGDTAASVEDTDWCELYELCAAEVFSDTDADYSSSTQAFCREELEYQDEQDPFSPACEDGVADIFLGATQTWSGSQGTWTTDAAACPDTFLEFGGYTPSVTLTGTEDGYELGLHTEFHSGGSSDYGDATCHTDFPYISCDEGISEKTDVGMRFQIEVLNHFDQFGDLDMLHVALGMTDAQGCEISGEYDLVGRLNGQRE